MKLTHIIALAALALGIQACSTQKTQLAYFTDIDSITEELPVFDYNQRIEPDDELIITVKSTNPEATAIYNLPFSNPAIRSELLNASNPQQQTYIVDSEGNIDFPELGRLHIQGMTVEQVRDMIAERISKDVTDPIVYVKLVNFMVDVLGEVNNPGRQRIRTQRYTLFDAIAAAGDLTPYGERKNVLLIREKDGKRIIKRFDLNSAETLAQPEFYLKQNDYIYVEPNKIRVDNSKYNTNNAYKLSLASSIISGVSVITSVVIALSR